MSFLLKKFLGYLLMPLPVCLMLMVAGLLLMRISPLLRPARRQRIGKRILTSGAILLLFFSHSLVGRWLLHSLESRYPAVPELAKAASLPADLARCRYVVVLGGGNSDQIGLSANNQLSTHALSRLAEGIRLLRNLPEARLIVSGPAAYGHPSHASILAQAAVSLGVPEERIVMIDTANDTEEEAAAVRALISDSPVALVTSAWHEPRAVALFRHAKVNVLPCPADFQAAANPEFRWTDFLWDEEGLERSTMAVHERIGYLWIWLRGKT